MVEGARLESVCTFTRTEGSNPSLSAKKIADHLVSYFLVLGWGLNPRFLRSKTPRVRRSEKRKRKFTFEPFRAKKRNEVEQYLSLIGVWCIVNGI